jgi:hypothetical protein
MKILSKLSIAVLLLSLAVSAWAVCPDAVGTFSTWNGLLLGGRVSEAWCNGNAGQTGNTQNAMSWDGAALGGQWKVWGQTVDADGAQLLVDNVNGSGNGTRLYRTYYDGGQFWLSKDGAWGNGVDDLTGSVTSCVVDITITFVGGQMVGATSNVSLTGSFDNCSTGCLIDYAITNAALIWRPGMGTMPNGYPSFLCGATVGDLFAACCPLLHISCVVADEDSDWGAVKSLYR